MAVDANGNYVKSADELNAYLQDSGTLFTNPAFINTNSIYDMNPILPVSGGNMKNTDSINGIVNLASKTFSGLSSSVTNSLILGLGIVVVAKLLLPSRGRR